MAPKPVWYRLSALESNVYRELVHGAVLESSEPDPGLGFHGVRRHLAEPELLDLELEAVRRIRHKLGKTNLWLLVPWVRTVDELESIKKHLAGFGLARKSSLKLFIELNTPLSVEFVEEFAEVGIDGLVVDVRSLWSLWSGSSAHLPIEQSELVEKKLGTVVEEVLVKARKLGLETHLRLEEDHQMHLVDWLRKGATWIHTNMEGITTTRWHIERAEDALFKD